MEIRNQESDADIQELVRRLASDSDQIVIEAVRALGEVDGREAIPPLIRVLQEARTAKVRNAAALALRDLEAVEASTTLVRMLADPRTARNRGNLLYALQPLDARWALVDLARAMCAGDYEDMAMVLMVIEAFKGPPLPENSRDALKVLRSCARDGQRPRWQKDMLRNAIEVLKKWS